MLITDLYRGKLTMKHKEGYQVKDALNSWMLSRMSTVFAHTLWRMLG